MTVPVQQGTLNRLRGSVVFAAFPELTVTAAYLAKEAISLNFGGDSAQNLPTMTGAVGSPEPYVMATVEIHLLRSQALSSAFKAQIEANSMIGSINVITDSEALENYQIEQCILQGVSGLNFDGNSPSFTVRITGIYYVNSQLWASS